MAGDEASPGDVLDRIDRPVFALDGDWRFTYLNAAAERLLSPSGGVLDGRVIWDAVPGVMDTDLPETFHAALTEGDTRRTTVRMDDDRHVEFEAYPDAGGDAGGDPGGHPGEGPPGESGSGGGLTVLLRDVTDRQRRRKRLGRYETAFNAADDPIYVLDDDGRIREVNDAMVELTGYEREQLVGSHMSLLLSAEELRRAERRIRETMLEDDQSVGTIEATITTASGVKRTCAVNVALLPEAGGFQGTVGVLRDVTAQHQREQRLAVLDRVLRHNIRNEMNLVIGRTELAMREADESVAEHLEAILSTARDLVGISQDIRRFSDALDPGIGEAKARDAAETVTAIVDDLDNRFDADLRVTLGDEARFYAHESVFAAIEELVGNAIAHTDDPEPTVTVRVHADEGAGEVRIEVRDRGPGLPEPEREVLTEGGETPLNHASGIGLWLVNWAVTKSGGYLTFEENDPTGSIVTVHLQRAPPAEVVEEAEAGGEAATTGTGKNGEERSAGGGDTPSGEAGGPRPDSTEN